MVRTHLPKHGCSKKKNTTQTETPVHTSGPKVVILTIWQQLCPPSIFHSWHKRLPRKTLKCFQWQDHIKTLNHSQIAAISGIFHFSSFDSSITSCPLLCSSVSHIHLSVTYAGFSILAHHRASLKEQALLSLWLRILFCLSARLQIKCSAFNICISLIYLEHQHFRKNYFWQAMQEKMHPHCWKWKCTA